MNDLTIGTFTPSFLIELARRDGSFERAGLRVFEAQVSSSPQQFRSLGAGEYDVVFTNPDNVLAYHFSEDNPLGERMSLRVLAGIDRGLGLGLFRGPGVDPASHALRLGVDVATSGFALIAYELLERAHHEARAREMLNLGATPLRVDALVEGRCDYTILNAGNELRALARGCVMVAAVQSIGPYLGTVLATRRDTDAATLDAVSRLRDVLGATVAEVMSGSRDDDVAAAVTSRLRLDHAQAREHLATVKDPGVGLVADLRVDRASMATVVALRQRHLPFAGIDGVLEELATFIDPEALA